MRRAARTTVVLLVVVAVGVGTFIGFRFAGRSTEEPHPDGCSVGLGSRPIALTLNQAESATTIAAVATRMHLPEQAVTVALATALQESKLLNVPFGDRDSLGLFQQRPSQGWGSPHQLLSPAYAAAAFFRHLAAVPDWRRLPLAKAAQAVQHSADGSAYAQWEEVAHVIASATTGEVGHGMTCSFGSPSGYDERQLRTAAARELGAGWQHPAGTRRAWQTAEWLVGHAFADGVASVQVGGERWSAATGEWSGRHPSQRLTFTLTPPPQTSTGSPSSMTRSSVPSGPRLRSMP